MNIQRVKSKKYLDYVRSLPCVITGQEGVHAHHLIGHGEGGMGLKSSDLLAFPLSSELHDELHRYGWKAWEEIHGSQWRFVAKTLHEAMEKKL
jgi:hypothetical protein